jgi:GNAT superfamily N-acetyltransferase
MITLRDPRPEDAADCGRICHDAFREIAEKHGFAPDFPDVETAVGLMTMLIGHPGFFGVVAESEGRLVGSNFLDERGTVAGIGPITIDPAAQNAGAGRRLMQAVLDRAHERRCAGVRLLQSSYHGRSLALYTTLGFVARESLACLQGSAVNEGRLAPGVRAASTADLAAINALCQEVHGHDRAGEAADAVEQGVALVVERDRAITGYSTGLAFFGHSVGRTNDDLAALIGSAPAFGGPGILVPIRNHELFRNCLARGLKVQQVLTLMTIGLYNEPRGAWMPSILY